jgi:NADPH2:quinone reductase
MKTIALMQFGDPSNFTALEAPTPAVVPRHLLIRVVAASVNPVDTKFRKNGPPIAPALPAVLGCDVAGVVDAVGEGVDGFRVGDEVYACAGGVRGLGGAYAEYLLADARLVALKPKTLSLREAAALPLVSITAWEGLFDRAKLQAGETVLVHGGAGGVGHVALQLAKLTGAKVFATVSSTAKADIARRLGADEVINYREETVEQYVARATGGKGFDVVFDGIGAANLPNSLAAAGLGGRVASIVTSGQQDITAMHGKGLTLHAVFMLVPMIYNVGRERHGRILRELAAHVDAGRVKPLLDPRRFTLDQVADAHRHLESGQAVGKIVIDVAA